jgi:hypothetical protein
MTSERADLRRVILAGILATSVLSVLMYVAPMVGLPKVDMAAAIGGFLDRPAVTFSMRWWIGLAVYFIAGSILSPLLFYYAVPALYGKPWVRGMEWGVLLWGFGAVWVMFYMGIAYYEPFTTEPSMSTVSSLAGHLIYGAALGVAAGHAVARPHDAAYGWFK